MAGRRSLEPPIGVRVPARQPFLLIGASPSGRALVWGTSRRRFDSCRSDRTYPVWVRSYPDRVGTSAGLVTMVARLLGTEAVRVRFPEPAPRGYSEVGSRKFGRLASRVRIPLAPPGEGRASAAQQRKVGAPQDRTLANGQAPRGDGKCNRKQTADGRASRIRQG